MPVLGKIWRVAVLTSGRGTNMAAVVGKSLADPGCPYRVVKVIADRPCLALATANSLGIATTLLDRKKPDFQSALREALADCDLIVLAGFLSILDEAIIQAHQGRILNIHPSLLPRHGGIGMHGIHVHEAVLRSAETESGCSCHLVTAQVDAGEVLVKKVVPVLPGDTPESLQARILPLEHHCLVEGIFCLISQLETDTARLKI